ncbi:membrane-associated proteins in eicosanoid and glutathione metabolism [Mycena vulgaris]|nr:membrane-associated proteins in eicosanoid and glutathione metabolism [Mycena vulgaris]
MSTITVPSGMSYVVAALMATMFLLVWQTVVVRKHRDRAGIHYPRAYAENQEVAASPLAMKFNCAQRAHQNTLETIPWIYVMTVVLATKYPLLSASSLGMWIFSRIAYTLGYITGNPDNVRVPVCIGSATYSPLRPAQRANIVTRISFIPSFLTLFLGSLYTTYLFLVEGV